MNIGPLILIPSSLLNFDSSGVIFVSTSSSPNSSLLNLDKSRSSNLSIRVSVSLGCTTGIPSEVLASVDIVPIGALPCSICFHTSSALHLNSLLINANKLSFSFFLPVLISSFSFPHLSLLKRVIMFIKYLEPMISSTKVVGTLAGSILASLCLFLIIALTHGSFFINSKALAAPPVLGCSHVLLVHFFPSSSTLPNLSKLGCNDCLMSSPFFLLFFLPSCSPKISLSILSILAFLTTLLSLMSCSPPLPCFLIDIVPLLIFLANSITN